MTDMKLCILTGAAGEVGRATAKRFAESGWSMILCDRTAEIAGLAKDLSAEFGHACLGIQMDLANDQEVDQIAKTALETGIPLRFLGLVAAINHPAVSIENLDMALWTECTM
jgi:NAD(P)-dependent dehydrogenase (short-subunit alcohol dehydrogenase family)